jgi:hypothetical protein
MPRYSTQFSSTALNAAEYDTERETLDITFANGRRYTYEGVPEHIWEGLRDAGSPGSYYASHIKGWY